LSRYLPNWAIISYLRSSLDEKLFYKPEGRGFGSRWCRSDFSLT